MRGRFFARNDLTARLPLSAHDDNLVGDIRTTVRFNYEWRIFIVSQVEKLLEKNRYLMTEADFDQLENLYLDMLVDFYT